MGSFRFPKNRASYCRNTKEPCARRPTVRERSSRAYFAYRLGSRKTASERRSVAVFAGEAFASYDTERLRQTLRWLARQENQIFLFTCREMEAEVLREEGIPFSEIHM